MKRLPRILSKKDRQDHINKFVAENPGQEKFKDFLNLLGDLATCNSNYVHNRETGHSEFAKGTTKFVIDIANKRNWISDVGELEWK